MNSEKQILALQNIAAYKYILIYNLSILFLTMTDDCAICLEAADGTTSIVKTGCCGKPFHLNCLCKWREDWCPCCKQAMNGEEEWPLAELAKMKELVEEEPSEVLPIDASKSFFMLLGRDDLEDFDFDDLLEDFKHLGNISAYGISTDKCGRYLGHAFVEFESQRSLEFLITAEQENAIATGEPEMFDRFQPRHANLFDKQYRMTKIDLEEFVVRVQWLTEKSTADDLKTMFSKAGTVTEVDFDPGSLLGVTIGVGFICFEEKACAQKAVQLFDGTMLHGKKIHVEIAYVLLRNIKFKSLF